MNVHDLLEECAKLPTIMDFDDELRLVRELKSLAIDDIKNNPLGFDEVLVILSLSHFDSGLFDITRDNEHVFLEFADWLYEVERLTGETLGVDPADFQMTYDEIRRAFIPTDPSKKRWAVTPWDRRPRAGWASAEFLDWTTWRGVPDVARVEFISRLRGGAWGLSQYEAVDVALFASCWEGYSMRGGPFPLLASLVYPVESGRVRLLMVVNTEPGVPDGWWGEHFPEDAAPGGRR
jgi:hypothetical protein